MNELRSHSFSLPSRFCLLTESHFVWYTDLHMLNEQARFHRDTVEFLDTGLSVNSKGSKALYLFKMVHHNLAERQREVFVLGFYEEQLDKWDVSLCVEQDIKFHDRTFLLIKNRLLKSSVHHRSLVQEGNPLADPDPSGLDDDGTVADTGFKPS